MSDSGGVSILGLDAAGTGAMSHKLMLHHCPRLIFQQFGKVRKEWELLLI